MICSPTVYVLTQNSYLYIVEKIESFAVYRVFQLDMTHFEVPDDQQKLTSKF